MWPAWYGINFTGAQILNRSIFNGIEDKIFSMNKVWDNLIKAECLFGQESNQTFFHVNNLDVYKELKDSKFIEFNRGTLIVDVGTGGGFPGIPLAILFPDCKFHLVDGVKKKIRVVDAISNNLGLKNVTTESERIEDLDDKFDFVLTRAVAEMPKIIKWTKNKINSVSNNKELNGIIALKGGDLNKELYKIENKKIVAINDYFDDHYFNDKKLVYVPLTQ